MYHFWKISLPDMDEEPEMMPLVLKTWRPESGESARLLRFLTAGLPSEFWEEQEDELKVKILHELITIDNGRGIIADWLASVIRMENEWMVLQTAATWKPQEGIWPSSLLASWSDKISDEKQNHKVVGLALQIVTSANLSAENLSANPRPETWGQKERAGVILKYLSESGSCTPEALDMIASAMTSPGFHDEKIMTALFRQWDHLMHSVVNENDWRRREWMTERMLIKMIKTAPCHTDVADVIMPWMEYSLQGDVSPAVLDVMAKWRPADENRQQQLMELWGRYRKRNLLLNHDKIRWEAWEFGWQFLTREGKPGPGWEGVGDNCLERLHQFLGLLQTSRPLPKQLVNILNNIDLPQGLTPAQQEEWQKLWVGLLHSTVWGVAGSAATHLLKLSAAGMSNPEGIKEAILNRLATATSLFEVECLLEGIRAWEKDSPGIPGMFCGMFCEACHRLRQSASWNDPQMRMTITRNLTSHLETVPQQSGASSELVALWLDILSKESDPGVIRQLGEWELSRRKRQFSPDQLSDAFFRSEEVWKKRRVDAKPKIREMAWTILCRMENVSGTSLVEHLSREAHCEVLWVMAGWNPPSGQPLPSGFWDEWGQCLRKTWDRGPAWRESVICLAERITENFAATWFSDRQRGENRAEEEISGMWNFWQKLIETAKLTTVSTDEINYQSLEKKRKTLGVLFALTAPPEIFYSQLSGLEGEEFCWLMKKLKDFGLFRDGLKKAPITDMTCNLALAATFTLGEKMNAGLLDTAQNALLNIWNHEMWRPDEIPPGWNRFREVLYQKIKKTIDVDLDGLLGLIHIGRKTKHPLCHRDFLKMMDGMMEAGNAPMATLAKHVFWSEAAIACEKLKEGCPERRKPDWQTEWRWLRQFIHVYPEPAGFRSGQSETRRAEVNRLCRSTRQELWENFRPAVGWESPQTAGQETERQRTERQEVKMQTMGKKIRLEERESFFCDPREVSGKPEVCQSGETPVGKNKWNESPQFSLPPLPH